MSKQQLSCKIKLLSSKLGYILACLASYSSLDLSKRLKKINDHLFKMAKSLQEEKVLLDIRDVIELKEQLWQMKQNFSDEDEVLFEGHKIACLLFEFSFQAESLKEELIHLEINEDFCEYLDYVAQFSYLCARWVNINIVCFENKLQ